MLPQHEALNDSLRLKTGWLCLDFANTVDFHNAPDPGERLNGYADFVAWAQQVGLVSDGGASHLNRAAGHNRLEAQDVLGRAVALREAIFHLLEAHIHGRTPEPRDLSVLNTELAQALEQASLRPTGGGYRLGWERLAENLAGPLWAVAHSAAALLTMPELLGRVGQCADDRGCGWLFLDTTKNRSRRWCDMRDCGNRAKARRHYERKREQAASGERPN
jgi:predicted RNA-binding Zn ribbon-like protein